jgi:lysophospholipase L1-like esterase
MFSDKVSVADHAASGSTLRASLSRGRLDKILQLIRPGDYLFIEFAHNDQKPGSGEEAFTTYNQYLKRYIDSARAHRAIPVLVTSTCRRAFDQHGKLTPTLGQFPDAMRYEAKKDGVALLDLNRMTRTLYETLGQDKSRELFVQFPRGTFPGQQTALADNTHFSDFGAYELARCMAHAISTSKLPLSQYLKPGAGNFDPAHPDDIRRWDLPFTPMYTSVKPYGN